MFHAAHDTLPHQTQPARFAPSFTTPPLKPADAQTAIISLWTQRDVLTQQQFSRALSEIVQRPVLVVDLGAMPHAPTVRNTNNHTETEFTAEQIKDRAHYLARQAQSILPEARDIWKKWKWREVSATICAPNIDELLVKGETAADVKNNTNLPTRLVGECWDKAAVIFAPDRRWSVKQEWQNMTGLGNRLEYHPPGTGVRVYTGGHETAHVEQLRIGFDSAIKDSNKAETVKWLIERDADLLPIKEMRHLGLNLKKQAQAENLTGAALAYNSAERREMVETAQAVKHMRAISGFLVSTPRYWSALALDNPRQLGLLSEPQDKKDGAAMQTFQQAALDAAEKSKLVGYELRWRVAAQLEGKPLQDNSATLQAKIKDWQDNPGPSADKHSHRYELNYWFSDIVSRDKNAKSSDEPKKSFYWSTVNDVQQAIPALKQVLASGAVTDPLTQRNGELVVRAAHYFAPSLQGETKAAMPFAVARSVSAQTYAL
jgi:hypothetical protein